MDQQETLQEGHRKKPAMVLRHSACEYSIEEGPMRKSDQSLEENWRLQRETPEEERPIKFFKIAPRVEGSTEPYSNTLHGSP